MLEVVHLEVGVNQSVEGDYRRDDLVVDHTLEDELGEGDELVLGRKIDELVEEDVIWLVLHGLDLLKQSLRIPQFLIENTSLDKRVKHSDNLFVELLILVFRRKNF